MITTQELTNEDKQLILELEKREKKQEYKTNFPKFSEECLKTLNKQGELVPLKLNNAQVMLNEAIDKMIEEKSFVKLIILKARQTGISTMVSGRTLWSCSNNENRKAALVAHVGDTSEAVHDKNKEFHALCPKEFITPVVKDTSMDLRLSNGSNIKAYTAKSPEAGRGITGQMFHGSEVAFWPQAEKTYNAIMQAISKGKGSEIYLESTANGIGDWFHGMWEKAKLEHTKPEDWNGYRTVFIPWFVMDEYTLPDEQMPLDYNFTDVEKDFKELHGVSDNQILWRRQMINEMGDASFKQEYPSNDEEAFMAEGFNVFNTEKLLTTEPRPSSTLAYDEDTGYFMPSMEGSLNVYYPRMSNMRYVIGADPAGGVGRDASAAVIIDQNMRVCATFADNNIGPTDFGRTIERLGRDWNNAYLIVEHNNHGGQTLQVLTDASYPNLYKRQRLDNFTKEYTEVPGFNTSAKTKMRIIDCLRVAFNEDRIELNCPFLIDEMRSYISRTEVSMGASTGAHDDLVIATCLASFAWEDDRDKIMRIETWNDKVEQWKFVNDNTTNNWL